VRGEIVKGDGKILCYNCMSLPSKEHWFGTYKGKSENKSGGSDTGDNITSDGTSEKIKDKGVSYAATGAADGFAGKEADTSKKKQIGEPPSSTITRDHCDRKAVAIEDNNTQQTPTTCPAVASSKDNKVSCDKKVLGRMHRH